MSSNRLNADLEIILQHGASLWPSLRNARIFITGGTGFIGTWLLESFVWLNDHLDLGMQAVVLTRNADAFIARSPDIGRHPNISLHVGDVRDFTFPQGQFSIVIHGATDASAKLNAEEPIRMFDTIVNGTRRTLDFAIQARANNFLLLSSGAVYGEQPANLEQLSESDLIGPDCSSTHAAYAEGKRAAELLCTLYAKQYGMDTKIARCFAFVGPYLPTDNHFAIGNFIRNAMAGETIQVYGDGTPYRSYLYAADLTLWLWTILINGKSAFPYNVGSDSAISIGELAKLVDRTLGGNGVDIKGKPQLGMFPKRYIPSVKRAETELGLVQTTPLEQAIIKTAHWHGWRAHK